MTEDIRKAINIRERVMAEVRQAMLDGKAFNIKESFERVLAEERLLDREFAE